MENEDKEPSRPTGPAIARRRRNPPAFNLPRSLMIGLVLLVAVFAVQSLLPADALDWFLINFGFMPLRYVVPLSEQSLQPYYTPVTYSLLHGGVEHLVFNCLSLMAFGAPVVRRIGTIRFLVFWVLSAVAAAGLHLVLNWGSEGLVIGASGVISGLMGAASRFVFGPLRPAHLNPRMSVGETLANRTALAFVLFWLVGNALVAIGIPLIGEGDQLIAWDAHIGGFVFGFFLFPLFDRPVTPPPPLPADWESDEAGPLQS